MRAVLLVLTLLPAACLIPKAEWDDDEPSDTSDTSGDTSDTSADPDDTGGDVEEEGPCPAHSGLDRVGTVWTYETTPGWEDATGYVGTSREEVTTFTVTADGAEVVVSYESEAEYAGGEDSSVTGERTYRCDADGAWLVREESDNSYTWDGHRFDTHTLDVIDGLLVVPADLAEGARWSAAWTVEHHVDGDAPSTTEHAGAWEVASVSRREVPAGAFDVLEIQRTEGGAERRYLHEEAGLVEGDEHHLLTWSRP